MSDCAPTPDLMRILILVVHGQQNKTQESVCADAKPYTERGGKPLVNRMVVVGNLYYYILWNRLAMPLGFFCTGAFEGMREWTMCN
jgi:hypothetical protein